MTPNIFRYTCRVTYAQCTVGNHIYYARYLDILEAARGEFARDAGMPLGVLQEQDTIFPVIGVEISYKAAARYDELLTTEVWVAECGGVRVTFGHRILKEDGTVVIEAVTKHVCTTRDEKPKRLPKDVLAKLEDRR
ncbi:MAG: acyl-CoA thioesterase [Limisphaerales bacterium]